MTLHWLHLGGHFFKCVVARGKGSSSVDPVMVVVNQELVTFKQKKKKPKNSQFNVKGQKLNLMLSHVLHVSTLFKC